MKGLGTLGVEAEESFHEVSCRLFPRSNPTIKDPFLFQRKTSTLFTAHRGMQVNRSNCGHIRRGHSMLQCHCGGSRTHSRCVQPQADELGSCVSSGNNLCPPSTAGTFMLRAIGEATKRWVQWPRSFRRKDPCAGRGRSLRRYRRGCGEQQWTRTQPCRAGKAERSKRRAGGTRCCTSSAK